MKVLRKKLKIVESSLVWLELELEYSRRKNIGKGQSLDKQKYGFKSKPLPIDWDAKGRRNEVRRNQDADKKQNRNAAHEETEVGIKDSVAWLNDAIKSAGYAEKLT